jgi:YD repeat-containing protein
VSQVGSYTFSYDCNGNMLTRTGSGRTYNQTWEGENRLTGISSAGTATFAYDGDGNRVKATVSGVTTVYVGNYFEHSGTVAKTYMYAGSQRVALRQGGTVYFLLGDHLGSTAVTANGSGRLHAELRFKPYGKRPLRFGKNLVTR